MIQFQFHFEAEAEFNEAAAFYESKLSHLKDAFIAEVERCITIIHQRPEAAAPLGKLLRKINLRRFPYTIFFITVLMDCSFWPLRIRVGALVIGAQG